MDTARARERTRSSLCRFCIVVAGLILLALLAGGCVVPQTSPASVPPAVLSASPTVPQPASPTALQPAPATPKSQPATKVLPGTKAQRTATPPTLTSAPSATPIPALPTVSRPLAQAAPAPCSEGSAPRSVDDFPEPAPILDGCFLIGRSLMHNLEVVSTWGSAIGENTVQVKSEGCMWNGEVQYDYVYTVSYSCDCPTSLAAIPEEPSGPWGVDFVGRTLCIDGNCTTERSTAGTPEPESWDCAQHHYAYTLYFTLERRSSNRSALS
jgi:hypothetical protein